MILSAQCMQWEELSLAGEYVLALSLIIYVFEIVIQRLFRTQKVSGSMPYNKILNIFLSGA